MGSLSSKHKLEMPCIKMVHVTVPKEPSKWEQYKKKREGYIPISTQYHQYKHTHISHS